MFIEEFKQCLPKGMELIDVTMDLGNDCFRDPVVEMTVRTHLNDLSPAKTECSKNSGNCSSVVGIAKVIHNDPATIVCWKDGTKTIVKCQDDDVYSKESGLALCIAKKVLGNKGNFNNVFKKWCDEE